MFATCGVFSGCTSSENTRIGSHHLSITIYSSYTPFWRRAGIHWSLTMQPDKGLLQAWNRCHQWNLWERHEILWEAVAFSATFLGSHQLWFNKVLPATGKGFHSFTASLRCICLNNNSCFLSLACSLRRGLRASLSCLSGFWWISVVSLTGSVCSSESKGLVIWGKNKQNKTCP